MAVEEQRRLVTVLARELAAVQTAPWDELSYQAFVVADRTQAHASLVGGWPPAPAQKPTSQAFAEALAELRAVTASADLGAWFTISLTVRADGEVDASYDFDTEPYFVPPVEPKSFVRDLEQYPREVDQQPAWLRERLSWGVLTPEQRHLAEVGKLALGLVPLYGGRQPFTVTVASGDVVVRDDWSGRRAVVAADGTVRSVDPEPTDMPL
ncbi:hypothetical protein [Cellulosimicrobium sp. E-16]|jgi:hypothetical protein|uniref:hypothetical protein n=1 Tax=Cellulosimicrobium sp. E-16 TaxID=3404049 RepID=UPI003CF7845E